MKHIRTFHRHLRLEHATDPRVTDDISFQKFLHFKSKSKVVAKRRLGARSSGRMNPEFLLSDRLYLTPDPVNWAEAPEDLLDNLRKLAPPPVEKFLLPSSSFADNLAAKFGM